MYPKPKNALTEDLVGAHADLQTEEGVQEFLAGGPAVILWLGNHILVNPVRVELEGRTGKALYMDAENRIYSCIISDSRLPTPIRIDC